jgi:hypothetical protein
MTKKKKVTPSPPPEIEMEKAPRNLVYETALILAERIDARATEQAHNKTESIRTQVLDILKRNGAEVEMLADILGCITPSKLVDHEREQIIRNMLAVPMTPNPFTEARTSGK